MSTLLDPEAALQRALAERDALSRRLSEAMAENGAQLASASILKAERNQLATRLADSELERGSLQSLVAILERKLAEDRGKDDTPDRSRDADRRAAELEIQIQAQEVKLRLAEEQLASLREEIGRLEENLEFIDIGLYRPHFTYEDSEEYKRALEETRARQKELIKTGGAVTAGTAWSVGGSAKEGQKMVAQYQKLILRSINAEADTAIANVSWNNAHVMGARIQKAFEMANKLGTVLGITATDAYKTLRLEELRLVYEHQQKKHEERENERRIRAAQREEEKVQRELEREKEDAEREARQAQREMAQVQAKVESAIGDEREALLSRIQELEQKVASATERGARAIAQAQLTRVGHVYIISNHGSFGERLFKIGLTRRLDPIERIRELGDASVPFPFDVHALIYSEDAPALEAKLHNCLWNSRINWANDRKEFFEATLEEVRQAITTCGAAVELLETPEAREFRLSRSNREAWKLGQVGGA